MHNYTTQTAPVARIFQIRTRSIDHIAYPADIKIFYSSEPYLQLRFSPAVKMTHVLK